MKILAFAGSNSTTSINKKLVVYATKKLSNHQVDLVDLNDYEMPIYGIDKEKSGIPQKAIDFAKKVDESDCIIVSLAEHNAAYSVAFKNIFDWISRIPNRKAWGDKNMIIMATSPGGRGGASVLELAKNTLPFSGAKVVSTFSLPSFNQNFDEQNGILDSDLKKSFEQTLDVLNTL